MRTNTQKGEGWWGRGRQKEREGERGTAIENNIRRLPPVIFSLLLLVLLLRTLLSQDKTISGVNSLLQLLIWSNCANSYPLQSPWSIPFKSLPVIRAIRSLLTMKLLTAYPSTLCPTVPEGNSIR